MNIQDRIKMVIKMHNLTSSAFADRIGVQRSSVSHILTGRNNPSLDFIEKTLNHFPRVNADWLIMGKTAIAESIDKSDPQSSEDLLVKSEVQADYTSTKKLEKVNNMRIIERIVVFYSDGTYEVTLPESSVSA